MNGQLQTLAALPPVPTDWGPELVQRRKIEITFKSKFSDLGCDAVYFTAHTTYQSGIPEDCHHEASFYTAVSTSELISSLLKLVRQYGCFPSLQSTNTFRKIRHIKTEKKYYFVIYTVLFTNWPFKSRVKSHLPFAGIVRQKQSLYRPRGAKRVSGS